MRRPVISALNPAIDWLNQIIKERKGSVNIKRCFAEGFDVGAGEPLLYISGSFLLLVDLETALLQKIGATCVAAYNAKAMVESLPKTSFLAKTLLVYLVSNLILIISSELFLLLLFKLAAILLFISLSPEKPVMIIL